MSRDVKSVTKKTLKYVGAFTIGAGVIATSSLVATGAAVGAVVEGFKAAQKAAKKVLNEKEETEIVDVEEMLEEEYSDEVVNEEKEEDVEKVIEHVAEVETTKMEDTKEI